MTRKSARCHSTGEKSGLGAGDGSFVPAPGSPFSSGGTKPYYLKSADINQDGAIDLVVPNYGNGSGSVNVFLGNGSGSFTRAGAGLANRGTGGPTAVVAADFNDDGRLDLAATNYSGNSVNVFLSALPAAAIIALPADGATVRTGLPVLYGFSEPGSTVEVFDGTRSLGTVTSDSFGFWSFTPNSSLADGSHVFSAVATDVYGATGWPSSPVRVTIDTELIRGTITLPGGEALSGVTVTASGGATATTDANGRFVFTGLSGLTPGSYTLSASLPGLVFPNGSAIVTSGATATADFSGGREVGSPVYALWNRALGQDNVLELENSGSSDLTVSVRVFDEAGAAASTLTVVLGAHEKRDVLVNPLVAPGSVYGHVRLDIDRPGEFSGRAVSYRMNGSRTGEEFSLVQLLDPPLHGETYVTFNTLQPSEDAEQQENVIPQWLQIVNLDPASERSFVITLYDQDGVRLSESEVALGALRRYDVAAGHQLAGPRRVGLVAVRPAAPASPYLAQLARYAYDAPAGVSPKTISFATEAPARPGVSYTLTAPVSTKGGASNWVVVANTGGAAATADVTFVGYDGGSNRTTVTLAARAQVHLPTENYLGREVSGVVRVKASGTGSLTAESSSYFLGDAGRVTAAYTSVARPIFPAVSLAGGYNTFLGQSNWLKLYNPGPVDVRATLAAYSYGGELTGTAVEVLVPAGRGLERELRSGIGFPFVSDTYGLLVVQAGATPIHAEILRVKPAGDRPNVVDLALPFALR